MLLLSLSQASLAQRDRGGRWVYLGEANVDGRADHGKISVGRVDGRFCALQVRVEHAPLEFQRVVVQDTNGGNEEVQLRHRIPAGGHRECLNSEEGIELFPALNFGMPEQVANRPSPKCASSDAEGRFLRVVIQQ
jgi:hypothetical protein